MGAALAGTMQVIGENVCGMDNESKFKNTPKGKQVTESPDLRFRVESFREFWDGKHGDIIVQTNVEDQRLCVDLMHYQPWK